MQGPAATANEARDFVHRDSRRGAADQGPELNSENQQKTSSNMNTEGST